MKIRNVCLMIMAIAWCSLQAAAAEFINLTPRPAEMTVGKGEMPLNPGLKIGYRDGTQTDMIAELQRFAAALNEATGLNAQVAEGKGDIYFEADAKVAPEGYRLDIGRKTATLKASDAAGLFYGLQTIKKLLPANVMARKRVDGIAYALPWVKINDFPRLPYRGYMLDVSRHFFDANEIKKMIDVMAIYKLNRFHWHLTDDQGWRLPVEKYPRLTRDGATNRNILRSDFSTQKQWREGLDTAYGPFAYTKDELRDVVAYAKERHIEVIPEVDMPGHMVAAIHAYPQFSTDPGSRLVPDTLSLDSEPTGNELSHFTHNIWNIAGVSRDVLDVSNPRVMQFAKDVIDELADVFPYPYIHIGGDEVPTFAWANSAACQQMKKELGLTTDRALQSWFMKQIADYAAQKHGRKIMAWNELISDDGADLDAVKQMNPTVMCWVGANEAAEMASNLGLNHIYSPIDRGYYINRSYKNIDKIGAGRDGSLRLTYTTNPPATEHLVGVQGTFWTEFVDRPEDLEYLTLPRLQAIAEHGWTPLKLMDYDDFLKRASADAELLRMAGYRFGEHQLTPDK